MKWVLFLVCLMGVSAATGCSGLRRHAYHSVTPSLQPAPQAGGWVALGVHDRRVEILTGDKEPDFSGLLRGGYGNPFDVRTERGTALSRDFADAIKRGLEKSGYRVTLVEIAATTAPEQAVASMAATGAPRLLLVRYSRWKSDTFINTALTYDVEAVAMDARGKPLAQAHKVGRDNLGGNAWNPGKYADQQVPEAFRARLEELLNDPALAATLKQSASRQTAVGGAVPQS